jgi:hypothetical protein
MKQGCDPGEHNTIPGNTIYSRYPLTLRRSQNGPPENAVSIIGIANTYASDISSVLAGSSDPSRESSTPAGASAAAAPAATDAISYDGREPATHVHLSDKVKAILARASTDQTVADRLKAFVAAHRSGNDGNASAQDNSSSSQTSKVDVEQSFAQLSGGTQATDDSPDSASVEVGTNFAAGLKADGYTISAVARAGDGSFQVEIMGPDGKSFLDRRFGTSGEFSSFSGITAGGAAQSYQRGNKEYITFSESAAAETSVTAASDAGTMSATSSGTRTSSVTFVVDFSTGAISMNEAESLSVSTTAQISQPGSGFSTLA